MRKGSLDLMGERMKIDRSARVEYPVLGFICCSHVRFRYIAEQMLTGYLCLASQMSAFETPLVLHPCRSIATYISNAHAPKGTILNSDMSS
jgi:hypothetical protein